MSKARNPKYSCTFCGKNANSASPVYSMRKTIWFQELCRLNQAKKVNICGKCVKTELKNLLTQQNETMRPLVDLIREKIPQIDEKFIEEKSAVRILTKLFVNNNKRAFDSSFDSNSTSNKRMRSDMEESHESGNTTTLAPIRGTLAGGGLPTRKRPPQSQPDSQPDGLPDSENTPENTQDFEPDRSFPTPQASSQTPAKSATKRGSIPHARRFRSPPPTPDIDSDEESEDEEMPPPRANQRGRPAAWEGSGMAPRQVPRIRTNDEGTRTTGA